MTTLATIIEIGSLRGQAQPVGRVFSSPLGAEGEHLGPQGAIPPKPVVRRLVSVGRRCLRRLASCSSDQTARQNNPPDKTSGRPTEHTDQ